MYLSSKFKWSNSAESSSVVKDNDAKASEIAFSVLSSSDGAFSWVSLILLLSMYVGGTRHQFRKFRGHLANSKHGIPLGLRQLFPKRHTQKLSRFETQTTMVTCWGNASSNRAAINCELSLFTSQVSRLISCNWVILSYSIHVFEVRLPDWSSFRNAKLRAWTKSLLFRNDEDEGVTGTNEDSGSSCSSAVQMSSHARRMIRTHF